MGSVIPSTDRLLSSFIVRYDSQFVNVLSLQDQLQECIDAMFERKVRINLPMLITGFKLQHKLVKFEMDTNSDYPCGM